MIQYFAIVNVAANEGHIAEADDQFIWSSDYPEGWRYIDLTGQYGTILTSGPDREMVEAALKEWLDNG